MMICILVATCYSWIGLLQIDDDSSDIVVDTWDLMVVIFYVWCWKWGVNGHQVFPKTVV